MDDVDVEVFGTQGAAEGLGQAHLVVDHQHPHAPSVPDGPEGILRVSYSTSQAKLSWIRHDGRMNPFDQPPADEPVSLEPPTPLIQQAPRRGRMVLVAVAAASLVGAGLIGISQFASADRAEITPSAGEPLPEPSAEDGDTDDGDHDDGDSDDGEHGPVVEGQIVIDNGDGEPIVIDLSEGSINGESMEQFGECVGLPVFGGEPGESPFGDFEDFPFEDFEGMLEEFPFGDFEAMLEDFPIEDFEGMFEEFGEFGGPGHFGEFATDGTHVTVMGPDGLTVIELGDGNGSVTITQDGGEVTIDTDGSATVNELDEMLGAIDFGDLESFDIESFDIEEMFEDFDIEEMIEDFEFEIPTEIQGCLDAIDNG